MDEIGGAAWRLMIQTWAHSPYGGLAAKLMFGNKHGQDGLNVFHTIALEVDVLEFASQSMQVVSSH